jgi:XTP/dITP diphosphohydrolase|tara:strand:+ start:935 stop:1540 length:606 start_codon:yes stop_codon:yes gene_type:complete
MKKNNSILIGTHNSGKFKELSLLLPKKLNKFSPKKLKIPSPKETGKSFVANSKLKVNFFYKHSQIPSIADDSGLSINCLNGKPGINSARWAKNCGGFRKAMNKIIRMVEIKNKNKKIKNTKAKFICCLSFKKGKKNCITATGIIHGNISNKILGSNGFGYDSIFIPKKYQITFGQMSKRKKLLIDHRFIAYKKIKKKINVL